MKNMNRRKFMRTLVLGGMAAVAMNYVKPEHVLAQGIGPQKTKKGKITPADRKAAAARTKAARQAAGITNVALVPNGAGVMVPDYFGTTPNYANSQLPILNATGAVSGGIRKFVDSLPGLTPAGANNLGKYIPIAVADTISYAGNLTTPASDYYEIGLVDYTEKMHSDLNNTTLRGYVQLETPVIAAIPNASKHILSTSMALISLMLPVDRSLV